MTQEDKELLLKDLYARSYYQPYVQLNPGAYNKPEKCWICGISGEDIYLNVDSDPFSLGDFEIKPYLRPMSSMTDEEKKKVHYFVENHKLGNCSRSGAISDYLNSIHIDYRGLIEKGLALEATEGMYKI